MALTRAQLLMGDGGQGTVLPGQVQAVKQGTGVVILPDGTINFDSTTATGVMRLNNGTAYNAYVWPTLGLPPGAGTVLSSDGSGNLEWSTIGFDLVVSGATVKVSLPCLSPSPASGIAANLATDGSLYWDNVLGALFVYYNDGNSSQWVQVIPSGGGGGGGGTGTVTSVGIIGTQGIGVVSGSPVLSAGNITLAIDLATLPPLP